MARGRGSRYSVAISSSDSGLGHGGGHRLHQQAGDFEAYPNRDSLSYMKAFGLENVRTMIRGTLDRMASGGIQDHVGGGFHRYTVERLRAENPEGAVVIQGDREAQIGLLVQVMDQVRKMVGV